MLVITSFHDLCLVKHREGGLQRKPFDNPSPQFVIKEANTLLISVTSLGYEFEDRDLGGCLCSLEKR